MDIRVECTCGQAYSFAVEPVNNLMPCPVICPACGADGTQLANQFIASATGPAPIPVPPPAPAPSGLRINRPPPAAAPLPAAGASPAPPVPPAPGFTRTYQPPKPLPDGKSTIPRGILGGVIGGGLAMAGWYFLTMATDHEFGIAAWLVGVITGLSVKICARDGSPALAYIAAVCAALAILGGEFLVVNAVLNKVAGEMKGAEHEAYDTMVKQAAEGVKLQTDDEIKAWLQTNDDSGEPVTAQDIENFKKTEQPKMRDLANGKPSFAEFVHDTNTETVGARFALFKASLTLFSLVWVFFGVGSAWRIASR